MSLTVNYQRRLYLLKETDQARALAGKSITVVESKDGSLQLGVGKGATLSVTRSWPCCRNGTNS